MKKIKIIKTGINGEGIGYDNRMPVFIEGALEGEIVDVEVTESYPSYKKGKAVMIHQKSPFRKVAKCYHQERCGGCSLMICEYDQQLKIKRSLVKEALIKYAQIDPKKIEDVIANDQPFAYRNQCKLPVKWLKGTLYSGMYKPQTNHLIYMDVCEVHETELDKVRKKLMDVLNRHEIRDYNERIERGLRTFVLRGFNGQYQCTLVTGKMTFSQEFIQDCLDVEGVVSLFQNVQLSSKTYETFSKDFIHLGGKKKLLLEIDGIKMHLSPASFFQLNLEQAKKLYNLVTEMIKPCTTLVEAYSGIGAISLMASSKAKKVVGIEFNSAAVKNAKENAKMNHKENVIFLCGDAAKILKNQLKESVDVIVVDPPRSGLDDDMIETMLRSKAKQIIYISCNPATLGKNLSFLTAQYEVDRIVPIDMFSQTPHVEVVVSLSKRSKGNR